MTNNCSPRLKWDAFQARIQGGGGGGACAGCYFSGNEHFSCKVVALRYQEIAYNHNNDVEFSNFQKEFRWSLVLQQYSMTIRHKSGKSHCNQMHILGYKINDSFIWVILFLFKNVICNMPGKRLFGNLIFIFK